MTVTNEEHTWGPKIPKKGLLYLIVSTEETRGFSVEWRHSNWHWRTDIPRSPLDLRPCPFAVWPWISVFDRWARRGSSQCVGRRSVRTKQVANKTDGKQNRWQTGPTLICDINKSLPFVDPGWPWWSGGGHQYVCTLAFIMEYGAVFRIPPMVWVIGNLWSLKCVPHGCTCVSVHLFASASVYIWNLRSVGLYVYRIIKSAYRFLLWNYIHFNSKDR